MGAAEAIAQSIYVTIDCATGSAGRVVDQRLAGFTERHAFELKDQLVESNIGDLRDLRIPTGCAGVVFILSTGVPDARLLRASARVLRNKQSVFFYWPAEGCVERIDYLRIKSYRRIDFFMRIYGRIKAISAYFSSRRGAAVPKRVVENTVDQGALAAQFELMGSEAVSLRTHNQGGISTLRSLAEQASAVGALDFATQLISICDYLESGLPTLERIEQQSRAGVAMMALAGNAKLSEGGELPLGMDVALTEVRQLRRAASPAPFSFSIPPTPERKLSGVGVYVRLDFWAPLTSGGSYGHTVYQTQALCATCDDFVAIVANPFKTLDELGIRQIVLQPDRREGNETNIVDANRFYIERLRAVLQTLRPAFVFERAVLGSYATAKICMELKIPYVVEYNGSEISMMRSFSGKGYEFEEFYLAVEDFTFNQASLVSVVSEQVAEDVRRRGVPDRRILVNPNSVNIDVYAPAATDERRRLRAGLGFSDSHRVVGFTGTYGGWHGIEVLAAALPKILRAEKEARFLLIGDGNLKHLVTASIANHGVSHLVVDVGRVAQSRGAELLKACDVLVSPHSSHMIDSKFFGSPTKLFEYMAMSAGIVASNLEQIGDILSPSLTVEEAKEGRGVGECRAVLCTPGNVDEFIEATLALVRNPEVSGQLGKNARKAAEQYYTWGHHVGDLWAAVCNAPAVGFRADLAAKNRITVAGAV